MSMKIVIADDHHLVREGLKILIDKAENIEIIGEAESGRQAVELSEKLNPDVIVMDVAMPDLNGMEAAQKIMLINPTAKILALSMHKEKKYIINMFKAGASGYLLKDDTYKELITAIEEVNNGNIYLSSTIANVIVKEILRNINNRENLICPGLTPKEREVLKLYAEGSSTKKIAYELKISVKTVETHRKHIMDKLGIYTIAELTKYAIKEGLTSL
jgi:DNA-binding NarL/FixJ family response regulator